MILHSAGLFFQETRLSKHLRPSAEARPAESSLTRRTLFAGAGAAGALAAAAAVLPRAPAQAVAEAAAKAVTPEADGYQLTEHVQRYYQTARV
jgi:hypothetical protein